MKRSEKGSASLELAIAGMTMALLLGTTAQFFGMIIQATNNAIQVRRQAFEILEGLVPGANHCEGLPIDDHQEAEVTWAGPANNFTFWGRIFENLRLPQRAVIWVGHKVSYKECS